MTRRAALLLSTGIALDLAALTLYLLGARP